MDKETCSHSSNSGLGDLAEVVSKKKSVRGGSEWGGGGGGGGGREGGQAGRVGLTHIIPPFFRADLQTTLVECGILSVLAVSPL